MGQYKPTVKLAMFAPSTLYRRLGTTHVYMVVVEGDQGYRAYFRFDSTKAAVVRKVQSPTAQAWMREASAILAESLTMYVMPYKVKVGSFTSAMNAEAYAEEVMAVEYREVTDTRQVAMLEAVKVAS
jgi:hypothetical protein